jgi:peroxiredoxin
MNRHKNLTFAVGLIIAMISPSAYAALQPGDKAPDFTADASLGGQTFRFDLNDALKKGPVVLYFYPAAFTSACTLEAHDFAEAIDKFKAEGATVIGVSHDSIETLTKFSVSECRGKFAVVADTDGTIMKAYDSVMTSLLGLADRTSYVIAPDHTILYSYSASDPDQHVGNTLQALHDWHASGEVSPMKNSK